MGTSAKKLFLELCKASCCCVGTQKLRIRGPGLNGICGLLCWRCRRLNEEAASHPPKRAPSQHGREQDGQSPGKHYRQIKEDAGHGGSVICQRVNAVACGEFQTIKGSPIETEHLCICEGPQRNGDCDGLNLFRERLKFSLLAFDFATNLTQFLRHREKIVDLISALQDG